jgi:hypothetical protein
VSGSFQTVATETAVVVVWIRSRSEDPRVAAEPMVQDNKQAVLLALILPIQLLPFLLENRFYDST